MNLCANFTGVYDEKKREYRLSDMVMFSKGVNMRQLLLRLGCTVLLWLAQWPQNKKVPCLKLSMEVACSLRACTGSLQVIQLPPKDQKHVCLILN